MQSVEPNRAKAPRIVREYTQNIPASADEIFVLLCPVQEKAWLAGWDYRMVYSESGYAEKQAVFTTREGDAETVWIVTHHDPENHEVHCARITTGLAATTLKVRVEADAANQSRVHIRYTHTSLSEPGDAFIEAITEAAFNERMRFWEDSMTHYLETGRTLSPAEFADRERNRLA